MCADARDAAQDVSKAFAAMSPDLQVEVYQNTLFKHVFVAGCQITCPDLRASNGIVHIVDCVLLPPPPQYVRRCAPVLGQRST